MECVSGSIDNLIIICLLLGMAVGVMIGAILADKIHKGFKEP